MRLLTILPLIFLSGCAAQFAARDDGVCQSYGVAPGSDAYVACRMQQDANRQAAFRHMAETGMRMQQMNRNDTTMTNCTTTGPYGMRNTSCVAQ